MGKKIRVKRLAGSLLSPMFQFTDKLQFYVNPLTDPHGSKQANHWYLMSKNTKGKYKAANFEAQINYDLQTSSSYVIFNFINGWKHHYFFKEGNN